MALETLKGVESIGGFKVIRKRGELTWDEFDEKRKEFPINITEEKGMISFKLQDGPIKENGVNGCQVDTLIYAARHIIEELNKKYPCSYNNDALASLDLAIRSLENRTKDREARGVEGTSEA